MQRFSSSTTWTSQTLAALLLASAVAEIRPLQASETKGDLPVTVQSRDHNAYGRALGNLDPEDFPRMLDGKRVFSRVWLPAGTGSADRDGLGPLFNATSCIDCHFKDGRGGQGQSPPPLVFRLPSPSERTGQHPQVEASEWGVQIQDRAVQGAAEATVSISFKTVEGRYTNGDVFRIRRPHFRVSETEIPVPANLRLSPRIPPILVGVGLLEFADPTVVLEWEDAADRDRNGVSGRARWLPSGEEPRLGRFGWKAEQASLPDQTAAALAEDMGVKSAHGGTSAGAEMRPEDFTRLIDYLRFLAPPRKRDDHPLFDQGEKVFHRVGCNTCHRPSLTTVKSKDRNFERTDAGATPRSRDGMDSIPTALLGQAIRPYTDLLLHDMGEELADIGPVQDKTSEWRREWRTPPLWGLGLMTTVNGSLRLLHDGRAQSFEEAVLWHGGEALASKQSFLQLSRADRAALVAFLESI